MFNIEKHEKHVATLRRHWLVFVGGLLPFIVAAYLALLLQDSFIQGSVWTPVGNVLFSAFPADLVYAGASLLLLVLWLGAVHFVTDFYLDTWIITDERLIGITQQGFFSRKIDSFRVERIQDVQTNVHGILPTLFNIGDIHVETAGHEHDLIMRTVGNPKKIRDMIMHVVRDTPGDLHDV